MIDIHSHILFGIDDGSKDIEESINILKKAINNGVTDVILTPHYRKIQDYTCDNYDKYKLYQQLKEEIQKQELSINIYIGNEITIDEDLFYYLNAEQAFSLNGSRYVLLELPFDKIYKDLDEVIDRLISKGNIPIIAHPERYLSYKDLSEFERLINKGVLFQGDLNSLYGKYGEKAKKNLEEMLRKHMIHFIASDVHYAVQTVYDRVEEALDKVIELTKSKTMAEELFKDNPRKVINNEKIDIYPIFKKRIKLKLFGGSR